MSSEELLQEVGAIAHLIDRAIEPADEARIFGAALDEIRIGGAGELPRVIYISHALHFDCLQVAVLAIAADGITSPAEIDWVFPLAYRAAGFLARCRDGYRDLAPLDHDEVTTFLERYRRDERPFGMACERTRWLGLELCKRFAQATRDDEVLDRYERAATQIVDAITELGGVTEAEAAERRRIVEMLALRRRIEESQEQAGGADARIEAFCNPQSPEVFSSVAQASQVWERDPFDVELVHGEARDAFEHLIESATGERSQTGRILLVRGGAGSGKTHLMRAFRSRLHGRQLGFAAYLQMTSRTEDYGRYALVNLIDSLERPYDPPVNQSSGLMEVSDALAEMPGCIAPERLRQLRDDSGESADPVSPLVDDLLAHPALSRFDPDLLRALLQLQRRDPRVTARAVKYLRCEELSDYDRSVLGGIASRSGEDAPLRTIIEIGRLIAATSGGALVFLVDQLEDIFNLGEARERFPRAVDVLRAVGDGAPSAIVVISCLDDMYEQVRPFLTRSALDRVEREPAPITLTGRRAASEVEAIVARRLQVLCEHQGARFREDEPLFPFRRAELDKLTNLRTRDVLNWCHDYRDRCVAAGELVAADEVLVGVVREEPHDAMDWAQRWNDARVGFTDSPPEEDVALLDLLTDAARQCAREIGAPIELRPDRVARILFVSLPQSGYAIGLCNRKAVGGALGKQIDALEAAAGEHRPALVRCGPFPDDPRTKIARRLGEIVRAGGRRVVVEDSEWRAVMAFVGFRDRHSHDPGFADWIVADRPLSQLATLRELFSLDALEIATQAARTRPEPAPGPGEPEPTPPTPAAPPPAAKKKARRSKAAEPTTSADSTPAPAAERGGTVHLGRQGGLGDHPVDIELTALRVHAGFLGTPGSGKTTVALSIIEQALEHGVSTVIIDRKGDLAGYADPAWWTAGAPAEAARKQALARSIEVALYTPGHPGGHSLALPLLPSNLEGASSRERAKAAQQAAESLGAMMGYRGREAEASRLVILGNAIALLLETRGAIELEDLVELTANQDPALLNKIGHLNPRHFNKLLDNLETLRYRHGDLLGSAAAPFDAGALFAPPGPRLSIISTKFLGDETRIEFWVSRFLVELARWASANPAPALQTLVFFDEADIYIPATSKPATKEPMLDLLKRARSAGVGLLLGTQNPGDFDYRSRDNIATWLVGKVAEARAVDKMKPLLSEYRASIESRLARQKTGEFFLLRGGKVVELRTARSMMETRQLPEDQIRGLATGPRRFT
jgi:hypothetical protein